MMAKQHDPYACASDRGYPKVSSSGWFPQSRIPITEVPLPPSCRVMVIDASLTVRMVVKTCLQRAGIEVFDFPDGIQALRWLYGSEDMLPVHLILLDLEIPKMNWYRVVQTLKICPASAKIDLVMLSRSDGFLDRLKAYLAGARCCIPKPFRTEDLLREVLSLLPKPDSLEIKASP